MKKSLSNLIITPIAVLALSTSAGVVANTENSSSINETYSEKKSSEQFWADFKQDSKQTWKDSKAAFKDGWIESKLSTAINLNKYLSPYDIYISVDNNMATLDGVVYSDIDKELAGNISLGVEGIDTVTNNLKVVQKPTATANNGASKGRSFAQYVDDATTTATIKTELLASKNIKGLEIDVDTLNNQVTLSGMVDTPAQKELAQAIAAKHDDVKGVVNNLQVKS
jgi:osmotically-inducible protein OsmY